MKTISKKKSADVVIIPYKFAYILYLRYATFHCTSKVYMYVVYFRYWLSNKYL